jgi:hypothetical protein
MACIVPYGGWLATTQMTDAQMRSIRVRTTFRWIVLVLVEAGEGWERSITP